jgi:3-hydroxyisobutyrate dehydrogenase-like beta-hydroxyacid dehydrogenase
VKQERTGIVKIAIIGLGEAGSRYATALGAQGHHVVGFDPAVRTPPDRVTLATSVPEAVSTAEVVLVMTGAKAATSVAESAAPALTPGACYADFTSSSPVVMEELGTLIAEQGAHFADVAILGPVPWHGAQTPLMTSGSGAKTIADLAGELGATVTVVEGPPGAAMAHKLLRSVFMKGLASIVVEAIEAGRAAGYEDWIRDQIAAQLAGDGHAVIDRLVTGTATHAARRAQEMADTASYLEAMGVAPLMSRATEASLRHMAGSKEDAS